MTDPAADIPDARQSPVTDRSNVPVPRLGTAATETTEESLRAEADAVGDGSEGGLTPPDDAQ